MNEHDKVAAAIKQVLSLDVVNRVFGGVAGNIHPKQIPEGQATLVISTDFQHVGYVKSWVTTQTIDELASILLDMLADIGRGLMERETNGRPN